MDKIYIGIDTSCYTTSLAVVDERQNIIGNFKIPLEVAQGQKGLMQSKAVFLHIGNIIEMFETINLRQFGTVAAVCTSVKPRPAEGSYMPVFKVSECIGRVIAGTAGAPFFESTHQEGHIAAALIGNTMPDCFLAAHVSGGTTELLKVRKKDGRFSIEIIGETKDIAAGQVVDRIGQAMDMPFPSGRSMEECAAGVEYDLAGYKVSVKKTDMNFSGIEAQALREIRENEPYKRISAKVLTSIAETLSLCVKNAVKITGLSDIILFGGVMSNERIRKILESDIKEVCFAQKEYSADNAAGLAMLAKMKLEV